MFPQWRLLTAAVLPSLPQLWSQQKLLQSIPDETSRADISLLNTKLEHEIPGNSPFKHCSSNFTDDILDINWVTLIPNEAHVGHGIQLMLNGTLTKDISKNATVRVHLAQKGSKYQPLNFLWDFCHPLEEVMQEDGPRCPPKKGGVEITGHAFVWFVSEGNITETTIEALTPKNETIACLYGEIDVVR